MHYNFLIEYFNLFVGNRWIVALWTATAHKQPPIDLSELQDIEIEYPNTYPVSVVVKKFVSLSELLLWFYKCAFNVLCLPSDTLSDS